MATPYALVFLERTSSTQDDARRLVGDFPTLVVAAEQEAGRGRSGAAWQNAPFALAASLAIRPGWPQEAWPRITLVAGLAALHALELHRPADAAPLGLKWPNDVMVGDRKVAGILTEVSSDLVVVGCGVNLAWPEPPDDIGAVFDAAPDASIRPEIAQRWAESLLSAVDGSSNHWPREEYRRRCTTIGRRITWDPDGAGTAVDVDADGALVVESDRGEVRVSAGTVRQVRDASEDGGSAPGGH